jgi:hypothetical protein
LVPVKSLRDLRGVVPAKSGSTFAAERVAAKSEVAKRISEESA